MCAVAPGRRCRRVGSSPGALSVDLSTLKVDGPAAGPEGAEHEVQVRGPP